MAVGAIGGISTTLYNPYVYNTRTVSSASLNPINRISDDPTDGGVDFSDVTEPAQNINPLQKGESQNFADILMSQMYTGAVKQMNAFGGSQDAVADTAYNFNKMLQAYGMN